MRKLMIGVNLGGVEGDRAKKSGTYPKAEPMADCKAVLAAH